eukprot:MONOS_10562.1-p1 / transcript=MONOS_10562.1 / gene=MONOS_10562 / organism=Monocercomonoides_exilis_PA203 / gene_product=unspecified product / transcript_product=unspecified product / location=Mono_scaffold00485:15038-15834(-) / protein_length=204 / sequence_SO=supercontig / SO=protein_coding / is_pseudo=false
MLFFLVTCGIWQNLDIRYLTKQSYLMTLLYFILVIPLRIEKRTKTSTNTKSSESSNCNDVPFRSKLAYIFAMIGMNSAITATFVYWILLRKSLPYLPPLYYWWFGINPHGLSFVLIFIDVVYFTNITFSYSHCIYAIIYYVLYTLMMTFNFFLTKEWLYPVLDIYSKTAKIIYPCLAISVTFIHSLLTFFCRLRRRINKSKSE